MPTIVRVTAFIFRKPATSTGKDWIRCCSPRCTPSPPLRDPVMCDARPRPVALLRAAAASSEKNKSGSMRGYGMLSFSCRNYSFQIANLGTETPFAYLAARRCAFLLAIGTWARTRKDPGVDRHPKDRCLARTRLGCRPSAACRKITTGSHVFCVG